MQSDAAPKSPSRKAQRAHQRQHRAVASAATRDRHAAYTLAQAKVARRAWRRSSFAAWWGCPTRRAAAAAAASPAPLPGAPGRRLTL